VLRAFVDDRLSPALGDTWAHSSTVSEYIRVPDATQRNATQRKLYQYELPLLVTNLTDPSVSVADENHILHTSQNTTCINITDSCCSRLRKPKN
jgi:hypothetical protein